MDSLSLCLHGCCRICDRRKRLCLGGSGDADRICTGSTLALLSYENTACRLGRVDAGAVSRPRNRGSVVGPNQIGAALLGHRRDCALVHSTAGEAGISLSRMPLTKLLEFSVPNSRAISIDSSMTTATGVPMRVIS